MDSLKKSYQPISCNYYDLLLAYATKRTIVDIQFINASTKKVVTTQDQIADVYTKKGEEFMKLKNGLTIRLDKIISVNKHVLADFDNTCQL